jgi:hypothetical protein
MLVIRITNYNSNDKIILGIEENLYDIIPGNVKLV